MGCLLVCAGTQVVNPAPHLLRAGGIGAASNKLALQQAGITAIVCASAVVPAYFPRQLSYHHVPVYDDASQDIASHFANTNAYIAKVHCVIYRPSTHQIQSLRQSTTAAVCSCTVTRVKAALLRLPWPTSSVCTAAAWQTRGRVSRLLDPLHTPTAGLSASCGDMRDNVEWMTPCHQTCGADFVPTCSTAVHCMSCRPNWQHP